MKHVSEDDSSFGHKREVFSVVDYCKRYGLDELEEKRLRKLLGSFATHHELQMNLRRQPAYR